MVQPIESTPFQPSRRSFVQAGLGLSVAGMCALGAMDQAFAQKAAKTAPAAPLIRPGDTVLFQGDSITDAGRKRDVSAANSDVALGHGYARLAAAQLLIERPDMGLKFFNRGNSGNKVYQLVERWQKDCLDLKPNVLSILIGVNDFDHRLKGDFKGTVETYETEYRDLIKQTKQALPNVRLVICEPFVLTVGKVTEKWFPGYDGYRAVARKIAEEAGAAFVPFQSMFDAATKIAPPAAWAADGIHPTSDGAALMAQWWLKAVGT